MLDLGAHQPGFAEVASKTCERFVENVALGHIGPCAATMPKKYQKYIQKYIYQNIPKNLVYIYINLDIFGYIFVFFRHGYVTKKNTKI